MANPNPFQARQGLKLQRQRAAGSLSDAQLIQWRALQAAEAVMYHAGDVGNAALVLGAVHAVTQAATAYARLVETTELQAQIDQLKAELEQLREGATLRKVVG